VVALAQAAEDDASPEHVRFVQSLLGTLGFYQGPIDGTLHAETLRAIARYAQAKGVGRRWLNDARVANALGKQLLMDFLSYAEVLGWLNESVPQRHSGAGPMLRQPWKTDNSLRR
jgi:hypothetical protein